MKIMRLRLLIIAMSVCLLAVFLPGSAYAQAFGIIEEYCNETQMLIDDALDDLGRNADDQIECFDDLDSCLNRADNTRESADCVSRFSRCSSSAIRDEEQACNEFLRGFRDAYRDASRQADRRDVEDEFLNSARQQQCTDDALNVARLCASLSDD